MDTLEDIDLAFLLELVELDDWKCGDRNTQQVCHSTPLTHPQSS